MRNPCQSKFVARMFRLGWVLVLCGTGSFSTVFLCAENRPAQAKKQTKPNPASFDELAKRAQAAMEADRVPEAIRLYARATRLRPGWSEGWWHLGTLLFDSGHFREARDAFTNFVTIEKKQPGPGFGMLGLSEFELKRYSKALVALDRGRKLGLGNNPDFTRNVLYHVGILYTRLGQPDRALQHLTLIANRTAAANPAAPKEAVFADSELLDAFGIAALRLPELPSEVSETQTPLVRLAGRAQALIALQDRVGAEAELKQLLVLYPSEPGVHYFYGVFLLQEHPNLATDELRREIEISPNHAVARIQLAFQFLNTGDYETGLKYAQEALVLAPNDFVAHVACGRLLQAMGKTDRALLELQIAIKLAPGSPDAHFALSRALAAAGKDREAASERAEFQRLKAEADAEQR